MCVCLLNLLTNYERFVIVSASVPSSCERESSVSATLSWGLVASSISLHEKAKMSGEETNESIFMASEENVGQPTAKSTPGDSNDAENNTTPKSKQSSAQNSLQRIQQRKQEICNLPQEKKFLKLAYYVQCQGQDCKCLGWKDSQDNSCRVCRHTMENHVSLLRLLTEEKINNLLGMVVDVDNIYMAMHKEEDPDRKRLYYYLFKVLRKSILAMDKPSVEGPLGQPPFEEPCISKAITSFVVYKFAHINLQEFQTMYDVAKMFLHCLNQWNYLNPSDQKAAVDPEEVDTYKINFTRWLVFCHVPAFCDSLPRFYTTSVFGRTMLRSVFKPMCKELMDKCHCGNYEVPADIRAIMNSLPRFLSMLEPEIYAEDSPIWNPEYRHILERVADDEYELVNEVERVTAMFNDEVTFTRSA